jgi:hypothetical protein
VADNKLIARASTRTGRAIRSKIACPGSYISLERGVKCESMSLSSQLGQWLIPARKSGVKVDCVIVSIFPHALEQEAVSTMVDLRKAFSEAECQLRPSEMTSLP